MQWGPGGVRSQSGEGQENRSRPARACDRAEVCSAASKVIPIRGIASRSGHPRNETVTRIAEKPIVRPLTATRTTQSFVSGVEQARDFLGASLVAGGAVKIFAEAASGLKGFKQALGFGHLSHLGVAIGRFEQGGGHQPM